MFKTMSLFFKSNFRKISEINRKYSSPSIKITKAVRIALFCLRLYLLALVGLLIYKFVTLLH
jgi:NAD(P)H-nitrite reductase large subunit